MQVCYFTGDMCKVDWQDNSEPRAQSTKPSVIATPSLDTLSIRGLPRSTRPDRRGRVQGKEDASFGQAVMLCRVLNTTEPKWILQIFYASNWCMWQPKERRRKRNDRENMRAREKRRKTGSSIFSEAQHPAAQTSSSPQKKNGVLVKYASFSEQENVALTDGCCAAELHGVRNCRRDQPKGLFLLRNCTCMRIHEVHWPPFSISHEKRTERGALIACEKHWLNCRKSLLSVANTLSHSHITQSLDTLIPCQNL